MKTKKWFWTGWAAAGALAIVMVTGAFQDAQPKYAVVDLNRALTESSYGEQVQGRMADYERRLTDALRFLNENRTLTREQMERFRELSREMSPTQAQRNELEQLRTEALRTNQRYQELNEKDDLTEAERTERNALLARRQQAEAAIQAWANEDFENLQRFVNDMERESLQRLREEVGRIAGAQGYTVVYSVNTVVYVSNDLTEDLKNALNAQQ